MKSIRIGKEIQIRWSNITTNGGPQTLEGRDFKVTVGNRRSQSEDVEFSISDEVIIVTIRGGQLTQPGEYGLTLWENYGTEGQTALDKSRVFRLVPSTEDEGGEDENDIETITLDLSGGDIETFTFGGLNLDIIKTGDTKEPTDKNVYSALRTLMMFMRKDAEDETRFLQKFRGGIHIGTFKAGIENGTGGMIDNDGNAELMSLVIRQFLEVPELRYNRLTIVGDEQWGTQGGTIETVYDDGIPDDKQFRIKLKLEGNEVNPFRKGDILKGIFNGTFINDEGIQVTGFYTMYGVVVSSEDEPNFEQGVFMINVKDKRFKPVSQMIIARIGNSLYELNEQGETVPVYPDRQRSWRISTARGNFQFYDNVDSWEIGPKNIKLHCGECKGENLPGVPATAEGFVFWGSSMYYQGTLRQIDSEGVEIPPIVFKGEWKAGETYTKNNQVTWKGCMYICIVDSTTAEPTYDSTDWLMIVGDPNFIMKLSSSAGDVLMENDLNTTLTATVFKYNQELTDRIPQQQWMWERESSDPESDKIWNLEHIGYGNAVNLTKADLPGWGLRRITFTCTAYITETESVKESTGL